MEHTLNTTMESNRLQLLDVNIWPKLMNLSTMVTNTHGVNLKIIGKLKNMGDGCLMTQVKQRIQINRYFS